VEARMAEAIGDWSTYDTDPNVRAWAGFSTGLWANSGLDWYVNQFKADSVSYHLGSWQYSGSTYWSLLVLIPGTPVVLELMGSCTVCGSQELTKKMPKGYLGAVPPLTVQPLTETPEQGTMYPTHISRMSSNLTTVKQYYKSVFGVEPVASGSLGTSSEFVDFQPSGTISIRYVTQAGQTGEQTTDWLEQVLLSTATKYQTSPSSCWPIWGDFHWSMMSFSTSILSLVTAAGKLGFPYRSFAGSAIGPSNAYMVDPSGMWVQVNGDSTGLPTPGGFEGSYCYTFCN